jgi:hypothetical protein
MWNYRGLVERGRMADKAGSTGFTYMVTSASVPAPLHNMLGRRRTIISLTCTLVVHVTSSLLCVLHLRRVRYGGGL